MAVALSGLIRSIQEIQGQRASLRSALAPGYILTRLRRNRPQRCSFKKPMQRLWLT